MPATRGVTVRTVTGVDSVVDGEEVVVEDVAVAEAEGRRARVEVVPVVACVGDRDRGVLRAVAI